MGRPFLMAQRPKNSTNNNNDQSHTQIPNIGLKIIAFILLLPILLPTFLFILFSLFPMHLFNFWWRKRNLLGGMKSPPIVIIPRRATSCSSEKTSYGSNSISGLKNFKVLTYNIAALPPYLNINPPRMRTSQLAKKIAMEDKDVDCLCFQEAFDDVIKNDLIKELKSTFPHIVKKPIPSLRLHTALLGYYLAQDSGLMIMSKVSGFLNGDGNGQTYKLTQPTLIIPSTQSFGRKRGSSATRPLEPTTWPRRGPLGWELMWGRVTLLWYSRPTHRLTLEQTPFGGR